MTEHRDLSHHQELRGVLAPSPGRRNETGNDTGWLRSRSASLSLPLLVVCAVLLCSFVLGRWRWAAFRSLPQGDDASVEQFRAGSSQALRIPTSLDLQPPVTSPPANDALAKRSPANSLTVNSPTGEHHAITIRQPAGPPRTSLGVAGMHGEPLQVACSTCHATREPNNLNRATADFDEFHQGIGFTHGNLSCLACHNAKNYDTLHLADGTGVAFQDVMSLCSQCHGTQRRDYDHGAHGGMSGYWDLSRGPRVRNNCVDCHHPHQPKFVKMNPTFKPRDRFLESRKVEHHE